jgi:hypothetical protein
MWRAIEALAERLEAMAEERCEPWFYLSSLDPGVGKTQTIIHFLKALLASAKHAHVGVIVCMFSINEIIRAASEAGLNRDQFAVLTSDEEANKLGTDNHPSARILFTTQQRVQKVCDDGRRFDDVQAFHYRGGLRQVRIWDESLLPAEPVAVPRDQIAGLYQYLRRQRPQLVNDLEALVEQLKHAEDKTFVDVPDYSTRHRLPLQHLMQVLDGRSEDVKKTASNLWHLIGKKASVRRDSADGGTLVSFRENLPSDLAPVVILDASGRIRTAYDWWKEKRRSLVRLPAGRKCYDKLTIHVWSIGGGITSFASEGAWNTRRQGIVSTINAKQREPWLVVCHKSHRERMESEVKGELLGDESRVKFIHWGVHRATNEFKDIENVILAGTQFYPKSGYEGIGRAASGLLPEDGALNDERDLVEGEHRHLILQAICRGAARKAVGDHCPPCHAYIIASLHSGIRELLSEVFPGCHVESWVPVPRELSGKVREAVEFITRWFEDQPDELLPFKTVMAAIGENDSSNFRNNIRRHSSFVQALAERDIEEDRNGTTRWRGFRQQAEGPSSFEDYFGPVVNTEIGPDGLRSLLLPNTDSQ